MRWWQSVVSWFHRPRDLARIERDFDALHEDLSQRRYDHGMNKVREIERWADELEAARIMSDVETRRKP